MMFMLMKIDLESDVPIYQQLHNSIMEGIASKELAPGDSLPSVRAMASDLGVNMHCVKRAGTGRFTSIGKGDGIRPRCQHAHGQ